MRAFRNERSFSGCTGKRYEAGGGPKKRQQIGDVHHRWPLMFRLIHA